MNDIIGAYEAKTHLSALLDRVAHGESVTITRNGKPVARLVPAGAPLLSEPEAGAIVEAFRQLRESLRASGVRPFAAEEIADLVRSGRKY